MRKKDGSIEKEIIQGTIEGTRGKGRPRTNWLDNIRKWTDLSTTQMMRATENRQNWRGIVHDAAYLRIEDG